MDCYSYRLKEALASFSLKIFITKKILETRFAPRNRKILILSLIEVDLVLIGGLWDPTTLLATAPVNLSWTISFSPLILI
jgi:hypothetical protein